MLSQAGPTLCPARLTAPLYVVYFAGGTDHYEPSLSLSVPPGHSLALGTSSLYARVWSA